MTAPAKREMLRFGMLALGAAVALALGVGALAQKGPEQPPAAGEPTAPTPEKPPGWDSVPSIPKDDVPLPVFAVPPAGPLCELEPTICSFAAKVLANTLHGDSSLAVSSAVAFIAECPADPPIHVLPLCDGRPGASVEAFRLASKGHMLVDRDEFLRALAGTLAPVRDSGPVSMRLAAVGCAQPNRDARPVCEAGYSISFYFTYGPDWEGMVVLSGLPRSASGEPGIFGVDYRRPEGGILDGGPDRLGGLFPGGQLGLDFYFQRWGDQANPPR